MMPKDGAAAWDLATLGQTVLNMKMARTPDPREQLQILPDSNQQQPEKKESKEQEDRGVIPLFFPSSTPSKVPFV